MISHGKITATASAVPDLIVTNDDLAKIMDTSDEWIYSRTGIKERRITEREDTSDLCVKVAERLLEKANIAAEDIDFILVATMTPDFATPSTACIVQSQIGATKAFAYDISAACSGFVYALSTAEKLLSTGQYKKGLVIGGETISKILDWQDRRTAVLFGDGAGGVLLEGQTEKKSILGEKLRADGSRCSSLTANRRVNENPYFKESLQPDSFLKMDGKGIYEFALRDVVSNIVEVLEDHQISKDDVDYLLLHQANVRIINKIASKTRIDRSKFLTNMDRYGNTSAASIPILLDEAVSSGKLVLGSGQKVVFTGYGGGLTWGSILLSL